MKTETTMARMATRAARAMPTIIHSWRALPCSRTVAGLGEALCRVVVDVRGRAVCSVSGWKSVAMEVLLFGDLLCCVEDRRRSTAMGVRARKVMRARRPPHAQME